MIPTRGGSLMNPREIVAAFDAYLSDRGLSLEAVVVGGAALGLLGHGV